VNTAGQPAHFESLRSRTIKGIDHTRKDLLEALKVAVEVWEGARIDAFTVVVRLVCEHIRAVVFRASRCFADATVTDSHADVEYDRIAQREEVVVRVVVL